jgi:hypothetical protein
LREQIGNFWLFFVVCVVVVCAVGASFWFVLGLFFGFWVCLRLLVGCGCGGFDGGFRVWNVEEAWKVNPANEAEPTKVYKNWDWLLGKNCTQPTDIKV